MERGVPAPACLGLLGGVCCGPDSALAGRVLGGEGWSVGDLLLGQGHQERR